MLLPKACTCTNQPVRLKLQALAETSLYCKGTCKRKSTGLETIKFLMFSADLENATLNPFKEAS